MKTVTKDANREKFYNAIQVASILNVSEQKGYSIIRECNMELQEQGVAVLKGRVLKDYFEKKYGIDIQKKEKEVKDSE